MEWILPRLVYMTVRCLSTNAKSLMLILSSVRSSISIVPQSSDLFEGTLRENIDPVGEYQDADIWVAITQAHLREYVESLPESLDTMVREAGSSLSSGQKQLLCFSRALLRMV
jgi:ATP-binding cassette, subfamily C (CFTR/MRP), member 1